MPKKKYPDMNATRYEPSNGRYDLMTTDQVLTLSSDDLELILVHLNSYYLLKEATSGDDFYHRLVELHNRYPESDFRLEVLPQDDGTH